VKQSISQIPEGNRKERGEKQTAALQQTDVGIRKYSKSSMENYEKETGKYSFKEETPSVKI
jgi:hypothetical protein